jgi:hypothetical protein
VSQLQTAQRVKEVSNQQSMQKFQNSVPEDQVTLSEQARRIRAAEEYRSNGSKQPGAQNILKELNTAEALDRRQMMNATSTSGVKLMFSDNINDELVKDSRLIKDSVFEYAISSARSLKADSAMSEGTGDSINIMVQGSKTEPSLSDLSESRKQFDMNNNYDLLRNLAKSGPEGGREIDLLKVQDLGKHTDTRFAVANMNQPNLPDANKALAMKMYAQVAQSQEI